jgi:hypothetical protein
MAGAVWVTGMDARIGKMNCSPFKLRVIVGSAAPIEVYKSVNLNVPFGRFARRRGGNEETTYKFYGGQEDGQCEGENDAPELPILWYAIREIIGTFRGGWRGRRRLRGRAGHTSSLVGEEMPKREKSRMKRRGMRDPIIEFRG